VNAAAVQADIQDFEVSAERLSDLRPDLVFQPLMSFGREPVADGNGQSTAFGTASKNLSPINDDRLRAIARPSSESSFAPVAPFGSVTNGSKNHLFLR